MPLSRRARLAGVGVYFGVAVVAPCWLTVRLTASDHPRAFEGIMMAGIVWLALAVCPHLVAAAALLPGRDHVRAATYLWAEALCAALTLLVAACTWLASRGLARLSVTGFGSGMVYLLVPLWVVLVTRGVYARLLPRTADAPTPS